MAAAKKNPGKKRAKSEAEGAVKSQAAGSPGSEEQAAPAEATNKPAGSRRKTARPQGRTRAKLAKKRVPGRPKHKRRTRYAPEQRAKVLAAAAKEGLTALQVQKRFGVTPVTYYSWRKKAGAPKRGGGVLRDLALDGQVEGQVRVEVRQRVRRMLDGMVREEIASYFGEEGAGSKRGRR